MLLISALMVYGSIPFLLAEKVSLKSCAGDHKFGSKLLCKVGNAMLSQLPVRMHGPAEGLLHLVMAATLIFPSWLLVKLIFARSHEKLS